MQHFETVVATQENFLHQCEQKLHARLSQESLKQPRREGPLDSQVEEPSFKRHNGASENPQGESEK